MGRDLRVGFFGGSFDPIHFGHLNLMVEIKEKCHLDHVLVCPAHLSPLKQEKPPAARKEERLEMANLAVEDIPWASVSEVEIERSAPSYTVETIELLSKKKSFDTLYLILYEDTAYTMSHWKQPEKILEMAKPLVGTHRGLDLDHLGGISSAVKSKLKEGAVRISFIDIRSTRIRNRLKNALFCGHLTPSKVLDYIDKNGLYSTI